ncbi:aminodeoxychorismate synthase component I [Streptococcus saliviloxodontae]|uniref:Para-aminobenzoate synthetase/4-amino-4-deoxychorismate lyase n=1 Tax=Streptococcus saliviloxodontae TaxID=1349416 RepID=A0ABS2PMV7_9STRE|nr:aminodeoxychorismate synthase component I [Streptococcus saliviloxodontae]MBM7636325.1 para-aminobenzoate synthetase/4-amino-4-deoxychorismate lyase [Streptococcus saliviloxodontae]
MHKKTVIDFKELGKRLIFQEALHELKAQELSEVRGILERVEQFQQKGYYVVGYLSYEASRAFDDKLAVADHALAGEYLAYFTVHNGVREEEFPQTYEAVEMPEIWEDLDSKEHYEEAIRQIHDNIRQGNTYQVNHTIRLKSSLTADSFAIYNRLMVEQQAGYNAYIAHDDVAILSASPELFFKKEGRTLQTRPMKGTTSRGLTYREDLAKQSWLAQDTKNRAENMMIVDLLRNDMGKICQIGSVEVVDLCRVEQFSTVWQMTSTIKGTLKEDALLSVFDALYPCGSITGAPKIATMAIINSLETLPRGVYCGAIGVCLPNGSAIFNVPIRTMQVQGDQAYYGVGGGITWDSQWQGEFEETRQKSAVLYRQQPVYELMSTGKVSGGKLYLAEAHTRRLREAAVYFNYSFDEAAFSLELERVIATLSSSPHRLRMRLAKDGKVSFDASPLTDLPESYTTVALQERDVTLSAFVTFKTTYRPHIPTMAKDVIFFAEDGRLQETSVANLILEIDGQWFTPKVSDGCLAGLYRQRLIEQGQVVEKTLYLEDLRRADRLFACNAVRGLYDIELIE